jgi:hemerythrin
MALITWNDTLSVNIKEIDEQHKKLIAMVNELHSAMGSGKGKEAMGSILGGLVDYTKGHFSAEELIMLKHQYPGYLKHKADHDALTKQVLDFQGKYTEGKTLVTVEIMNFLKDWLTNHIQNTDKKYGPFLNGKGVV